jgi:hypothetical protein
MCKLHQNFPQSYGFFFFLFMFMYELRGEYILKAGKVSHDIKLSPGDNGIN